MSVEMTDEGTTGRRRTSGEQMREDETITGAGIMGVLVTLTVHVVSGISESDRQWFLSRATGIVRCVWTTTLRRVHNAGAAMLQRYQLLAPVCLLGLVTGIALTAAT